MQKYFNKRIASYKHVVKNVVRLALGMDIGAVEGLVEDGYEFLEGRVRATLLKLKNLHNKNFRSNLRKCK